MMCSEMLIWYQAMIRQRHDLKSWFVTLNTTYFAWLTNINTGTGTMAILGVGLIGWTLSYKRHCGSEISNDMHAVTCSRNLYSCRLSFQLHALSIIRHQPGGRVHPQFTNMQSPTGMKGWFHPSRAALWRFTKFCHQPSSQSCPPLPHYLSFTLCAHTYAYSAQTPHVTTHIILPPPSPPCYHILLF